MKRKILSVLLACTMVVTMFVGCGQKSDSASSDKSETKTEAKSDSGAEDDYVVQIPISTSLCSAPMQLAVINGLFDLTGIFHGFVYALLHNVHSVLLIFHV